MQSCDGLKAKRQTIGIVPPRYHRDALEPVPCGMEIGLDVKQKDRTPDHAAGARATRRVKWFRGSAPIDIGPMPVPQMSTGSDKHALEATRAANRRLPVEEKPRQAGTRWQQPNGYLFTAANFLFFWHPLR